MKGTLDFTIGTSFKCNWEGQELTGTVRVEGKAQADLMYCRATRDTPSDFEVDNVEILEMSLVEFEDLSHEVADEDALYEYLSENNVIDGDIEEEIMTEFDFPQWDVEQ